MFLAICKWALISLTLIFLLHYLYTFLMNTLTVPKIKDLVNKPAEQYKDMFSTLAQNQMKYKEREIANNKMEDELSSYLHDLKAPMGMHSGGIQSGGMHNNNSGMHSGGKVDLHSSMGMSINNNIEHNLDNLAASNDNDFNYASLLNGGSVLA
jgi:hypothetical protein